MALTNIKPRQLPAPLILEQRKSDFLKVIADWSKAKESGIFADNFFLDYFPEKLKIATAEAFTKAGKMQSVGDVVPENQLRGNFIFRYENANIKVSFTLTSENSPMVQEYHLDVINP